MIRMAVSGMENKHDEKEDNVGDLSSTLVRSKWEQK